MPAEIEMKEEKLQELMAQLADDLQAYQKAGKKERESVANQLNERINRAKQVIEGYRIEFKAISHEDKKVYREEDGGLRRGAECVWREGRRDNLWRVNSGVAFLEKLFLGLLIGCNSGASSQISRKFHTTLPSLIHLSSTIQTYKLPEHFPPKITDIQMSLQCRQFVDRR